MSLEFRDKWLEHFYEEDKRHRFIPSNISNALYRKLEILDAAKAEADLRVPPGNRLRAFRRKFERLVFYPSE